MMKFIARLVNNHKLIVREKGGGEGRCKIQENEIAMGQMWDKKGGDGGLFMSGTLFDGYLR